MIVVVAIFQGCAGSGVTHRKGIESGEMALVDLLDASHLAQYTNPVVRDLCVI